ncbi:MAG: hypothetical protein AB7E83_03530 [Ramlibacter sp.]
MKLGKQALKGEHRNLLIERRNATVLSSVDFEEAMIGKMPNEKRWDYFVEASTLPSALHAVEVHEFDKQALVGKKNGTLRLLDEYCPSARDEIKSWNVALKGEAPRSDNVNRFFADTKIRVGRQVQIAGLPV